MKLPNELRLKRRELRPQGGPILNHARRQRRMSVEDIIWVREPTLQTGRWLKWDAYTERSGHRSGQIVGSALEVGRDVDDQYPEPTCGVGVTGAENWLPFKP